MTRLALVTGGTRGIGAAISRGLNQAGYSVVASYASNDQAAEAFKMETGIPVAKFDVSDFSSCEAAIKKIQDDIDGIDIVVNNAGITRDAMMHRMTHEMWSQVMRTNLDSLFNVTRAVIEGMRSQGFGRVINISSINGQKGQMGQTNYSASKAGVIGFTKALAQESALKGITVNCICPGYIDTDMVAAVAPDVLQKIIAQIPVGRLGQADEIAQLCVYLCSDAAAFMTGSVLTINGGQYYANG